MNGLGGLNKSPNGVVIGLVQLKLEQIDTPDDVARQTLRIVDLVAKARRNMATMDLVVFPEYALHGLSMSTDPSDHVPDGRAGGGGVQAGLHRQQDLGLLLDHGARTPPAIRTTSGWSSTTTGEIKLYYRKLHPWVPVEPWEPGDLGIPVIDGPNGCRLALIICHDGMFPEMARECAYKGAEIMLRTAGYTAPIRESWRFTNQANAFQNLMVTANVCMCGSDGTFDSMGEGMICDFDGTRSIAHGTTGRGPTRSSPRRCARTSCARRAGPGAPRTTSTSSATAAIHCREGRRQATARTPTCTTSSPAATGCRGRPK